MRANTENGRCKFVSFSGMDGAGKSTQIETLRRRLQEAGLTVRIITFWDDVAQLTHVREVSGHKLFKGDKGVGSPDAPINRRDKNVRSWMMTWVRFGLYTLDAISLRRVVGHALRSNADFVICDRYIYDELSNLNLSNPVARVFIRMIMKIVPRPDVSYLLDADPAQARARKPEYPIDFLHISRASYMALTKLVGGITVIAPMPVLDVAQHIFDPVIKLLSPGSIPSYPGDKLVV